MTLPALDIPLALPFELPLLLHSVAVHFAIALPVIILLLELSNLVFKKRALSVTSLMFMILLVVVYFAAFFTGKVDGSEAGPLLSSVGKEELKEHKLIGTYLVYASIVLVAVKAFSMLVARGWAKGLSILILVLFVAGSLKQGRDGGELVYEHGANNKLVSAHEDTIDDLNDALKELEAKLDAAKEVSGATLEVVKEVEKSAQEEASKSVATEVIQDAKQSVQESYDKVVETTTEVVDAVTEQVKEAADTVKKAVTNVIEEVNATEDNLSTQASEISAVPWTKTNTMQRGAIATH